MKPDTASTGPPNWTCSVCDAANSATRANCWRCGGAPRSQAIPPANDAPAARRGVRLGLLLPICLVAALALGAGLWWKLGQVRGSHAVEAEKESAQAGTDQLSEALARVPLVNARANDCLQSSNFAAGLKMVDELLAVVDAPELNETKVNLLIKAGRGHEAYELLLVLLQKQPDAMHLHYLAGVLAASVKDPKAAMAHLGEAYRLAPENKAYQAAWAKASLMAGLRDPAVATFNKLLAEDPQCTPCWMDFASAFYFSGHPLEAISLMQQAVNRFPTNPAYHYTMARILDLMGTKAADKEKLQTAASYYRKSLELQPRRNSLAAQRYYEITRTRVPPQLEAIRTDEILLSRRGSSLYVQASINGVPGNFVLDTGASFTAVSAGSLERFKVIPGSRTAKMTTANGIIQAPVAYADIDLGQHTLRQALIIVLPESVGPGCDGLFGLDSMRRLGAQLDTARGCLVIREDQTEASFGQ